MTKILLVEDVPVLGKSLKITLEVAKYTVVWAHNLKEAGEKNESEPFHLIVLDINLPDGSGLNFCQTLRQVGSKLPILILTARVDEDTAVTALTNGANDFIRKPFSSKELVARIRNALSEPQMREEQLRVGPILILKSQRKILVSNIELELNRKEYELFVHFASHVGNVISRDTLIESISEASEIIDRTVDSHISHIRTKLKKRNISQVQIESVYGVGYKLEIV